MATRPLIGPLIAAILILWPGSKLHWFPGNHILHLDRRAYLKLMRSFMDRAVAAV